MHSIITKKAGLLLFLSAALLFCSCKTDPKDPTADKKKINTVLDSWHQAAAKADYNNYFKFFSEDAIFIGTDATENWDKKRFMTWAKPYFDKGKAWSFTSLERNVYMNEALTFAWFDELLNTQMKICRGSGVLVKQDDEWKIQQYVLSMTVPNPQVDSVVAIKSTLENDLIEQLKYK